MRLRCFRAPPSEIGYLTAKIFHNPLHRTRVTFFCAKVPGFGEILTFGIKLFSQQQVTEKWLQHVLPWSDCPRGADRQHLASIQCQQKIRYESIHRPITATNHITCLSTSEMNAGRLEKDAAVTTR